MDKGIRPAARAAFPAWNQRRLAGEFENNTEFRRAFCNWLEQDFGIGHDSATSAYNIARKEFAAANPLLVEGLGRPPEKNNGGRKKKAKAEIAAAIMLLGWNGRMQNESSLLPYVAPQVPEADGAEQGIYVVRKKKDNSVICETEDFAEAQEIVHSMRYKGKMTGKAYWV
jgi:hypothetical protein